MTAPIPIEKVFEENRGFLRALLYRMTGSIADAEDILQETFVRMMERPPRDQLRPLRPWATRVAMNLACDLLRKRRRRRVNFHWLPSPLGFGEGDAVATEPPDRAPDPQRHHELTENVSYAFLIAMESLTAQQRAVLLLRDVLDYTVRETAQALGLRPDNVKTTHLRARRVLQQRTSNVVPARPDTRSRRVLEQFLDGLARGDAAGVENLLAEDVVALSDGGGMYHAAHVPVLGRDRVLRLLSGLSARMGGTPRFVMTTLNGLPAVIGERIDEPPKGFARRFVLLAEIDVELRIRRIYSVLDPRKLRGIRWELLR